MLVSLGQALRAVSPLLLSMLSYPRDPKAVWGTSTTLFSWTPCSHGWPCDPDTRRQRDTSKHCWQPSRTFRRHSPLGFRPFPCLQHSLKVCGHCRGHATHRIKEQGGRKTEGSWVTGGSPASYTSSDLLSLAYLLYEKNEPFFSRAPDNCVLNCYMCSK